MSQSNSNTKKPSHYAYQVRESANGKGFWNRVGVAWAIKDGGFSIQLESIPLDGRILLQIPKEKEESAAESQSA